MSGIDTWQQLSYKQVVFVYKDVFSHVQSQQGFHLKYIRTSGLTDLAVYQCQCECKYVYVTMVKEDAFAVILMLTS